MPWEKRGSGYTTKRGGFVRNPAQYEKLKAKYGKKQAAAITNSVNKSLRVVGASDSDEALKAARAAYPNRTIFRSEIETPEVKRGRDGKFMKQDGFQMIDLAIDEHDESPEEIEKKWDTLANIDRKSAQQRKKQRNAARVTDLAGTTAVVGALASPRGRQQAKVVGRQLKSSGKNAFKLAQHPKGTGAAWKRTGSALGRTALKNPVGTALVGSGAVAAGAASKFGYHKARENQLNATARARRSRLHKAMTPDLKAARDTQYKKRNAAGNTAVLSAGGATVAGLYGGVHQMSRARHSIGMLKGVRGMAGSGAVVRSAGVIARKNPLAAATVGGGAAAVGFAGKQIHHQKLADQITRQARKRAPMAKSLFEFSKDNPTTADSHINRAIAQSKPKLLPTPNLVKPAAQMTSTAVKGKMQRVQSTFGKGIGDDKAPRRPGQWGASGRTAVWGGFGAASAAKGGKKLRTGLLAAGRGTVESTAASYGGQAVGMLTKKPVIGRALSSAGSIGAGIHGGVASVRNSRKKGYLRRGF